MSGDREVNSKVPLDCWDGWRCVCAWLSESKLNLFELVHLDELADKLKLKSNDRFSESLVIEVGDDCEENLDDIF